MSATSPSAPTGTSAARCAPKPAPQHVRINTTALRAFLLWGYRHSPRYFTAEQVEYLSPGVVMPRPALLGTPAPRRRGSTRRVGQSGDYIEDEDLPSAAQIVALGEALETRVGPWGRFSPELAASCGPAGANGSSSPPTAPTPTAARSPTHRTCTSNGRSTPAPTPATPAAAGPDPRETRPGSHRFAGLVHGLSVAQRHIGANPRRAHRATQRHQPRGTSVPDPERPLVVALLLRLGRADPRHASRRVAATRLDRGARCLGPDDRVLRPGNPLPHSRGTHVALASSQVRPRRGRPLPRRPGRVDGSRRIRERSDRAEPVPPDRRRAHPPRTSAVPRLRSVPPASSG